MGIWKIWELVGKWDWELEKGDYLKRGQITTI